MFISLYPRCPTRGRKCIRHASGRNRYQLLVETGKVALALLFSLQAFGADAPLTLAEAQRLAVAHSRQLPAQDLAVAASREMAVAAGQLPDPVVKFGIDNLPVSGADRLSLTSDFMTMRRVGVMQEITRDDKLRSRAERYERVAEKSLAEKATVTAAIERDTATAWFDRYYAEQMAAAMAEQVAQARLEVQAAEGAYRGGRGSQADLLAARSALAALEDRTSELQLKVRNAKTVLARWTGESAEAMLAGKPPMEDLRLDPTMLETDLAHHPQIAALDRQTDIATADAKLAQADKSADWSVELAYQQRGPAYANMISIGVSIPLQWDQKNRQNRDLSAKMAMVEQARAERDEAVRAHVAETLTMLDEWHNDRERQVRYEQELIPLAEQRSAALMAAYRGGKASLADLLAARRGQIEVRIQSLQLQADTARLWAQLNFLSPTNHEDKQ
jgi:outer membrane protein TolC